MASEETWNIGFLVTEVSIVAMALSAICVGSYASVKYIKSLKEKGEAPEWPPLSTKGIWKFLLESSLFLVFLYVSTKLDKIKKEESKLDSSAEPSVSMVDSVIIFMFLAPCSKLLRPLFSFLVSPILYDIQYQLCFKKKKGAEEKYLVDKHFTTHDVISFLGCLILFMWFILTKNWIINNVIAIVLAISFIKHFHLNKMATGCALLTLFIIYDVFFVFGTDIMDTVATSLDIPAKLMFPSDIMKKGWNDDRFWMLGVGDVVFPGAMIAFLLRFDLSLGRNSWFYFFTSITSYMVGLLIASVVSYLAQRSQPALIYLVPCSVIPPLVLALFRGDGTELFKFEDHPESEGQNEDNQPDSSHSLPSSKDIPDKEKDD